MDKEMYIKASNIQWEIEKMQSEVEGYNKIIETYSNTKFCEINFAYEGSSIPPTKIPSKFLIKCLLETIKEISESILELEKEFNEL